MDEHNVKKVILHGKTRRSREKIRIPGVLLHTDLRNEKLCASMYHRTFSLPSSEKKMVWRETARFSCIRIKVTSDYDPVARSLFCS